MKTGDVGRADLLDAYAAGGPALQAVVARLLGMEFVAPEPVVAVPEIQSTALLPIAEPSAPAVTLELPLWRAQSYQQLAAAGTEDESQNVEPLAEDQTLPPVEPLEFQPLATSAGIITKLRRASSFDRASGELDVAKIVDQISRGRIPGVLPRRKRKVWGQSIVVVVDEHDHLKPYYDDQTAVLQALERFYPKDGVKVVTLSRAARAESFPLPDPGVTVLALTDLGALERDEDRSRRTWRALGKRFRARGVRALALVPCDVACIPLDLAREWIVIPWESHLVSRAAGLGPSQVEQVAQSVLALLSYALRIEPILIRAVRRLLVKGHRGAGVEARVWQDSALQCQEYEAAEFASGQAAPHQPNFAREDPAIRREIVRLLRRAHLSEYEFVWFLERLNLEAETQTLGLTDADLAAAGRWAKSRETALEADPDLDARSDESLWFRRAFARAPDRPLQGSAGDALHKIWALTRAREDQPPAGLNPSRVPALGRPLRTYEIRQHGDCLLARPFESGTRAPGSLVALIRSRIGCLRVEEVAPFWLGGPPPAWAEDWGWDAFGAWVTFRVGAVVQRMRWIPPGTFLMGSPEDEEGRFDDEGPRHLEKIERGFWMFDTPCTQALWEAVMGVNPSQFKGKDRPVERVNWNDCQKFVTTLKEKCPGLELSLPTEAQWEYACRAGTETARYRENLDDIAWYGKNSGDVTHPVGQKLSNDWGLYDTLGNVWEWCEDAWRSDYTKKAGASADRVIRGGSWGIDARFVRAAHRYRDEPTFRHNDLGCRLAEFRSGREPSMQSSKHAVAEGARERGGGRGATGDRDQASAAGWLNLDAVGKNRLNFAAVTPRRICSDVERIVLDTITRPAWASALGRDKYGLWSEFTIAGKPARVRQRLRWIPPGRFMMGSPKDEEGRFDWEQLPHEVVIDEGFWMFATPCTQALWETIMPKHESRFRSPDRSVERVTWNECVEFADKLTGRINEGIRQDDDKLLLSLPTEEKWEYACRAGTTTSTYAGQMEIKGENNAPILDTIAWYGGNSGHEFDLDNGEDASKWPNKQYPFNKAGTRPVAQKRANPWGLYDMLGNVWEWCEDEWVHGGSGEASADRVIRGGSWYDDARDVRTAYRNDYEPTARYSNIGCRLAESREGREHSKPSGVSQGSEAEVAEQPETAPRRTKRRGRKSGWIEWVPGAVISSLVPTVLRGNAVFDAPRRLRSISQVVVYVELPASDRLGTDSEDAERPRPHSHAERGNELMPRRARFRARRARTFWRGPRDGSPRLGDVPVKRTQRSLARRFAKRTQPPPVSNCQRATGARGIAATRIGVVSGTALCQRICHIREPLTHSHHGARPLSRDVSPVASSLRQWTSHVREKPRQRRRHGESPATDDGDRPAITSLRQWTSHVREK